MSFCIPMVAYIFITMDYMATETDSYWTVLIWTHALGEHVVWGVSIWLIMLDVSVLFCFVSLQTLWYGKVVDETRTDQETEAIRACNELLSTDERIDISFIQVGDGTTLCRKKWYIDQYRFFGVFCWHSTASRLEINTSTNQFWMTHTIDHFLWKGHLMLFLCNLW